MKVSVTSSRAVFLRAHKTCHLCHDVTESMVWPRFTDRKLVRWEGLRGSCSRVFPSRVFVHIIRLGFKEQRLWSGLCVANGNSRDKCLTHSTQEILYVNHIAWLLLEAWYLKWEMENRRIWRKTMGGNHIYLKRCRILPRLCRENGWRRGPHRWSKSWRSPRQLPPGASGLPRNHGKLKTPWGKKTRENT